MFGFLRRLFGRRKKNRGRPTPPPGPGNHGGKAKWKIPSGMSLAVSRKSIEEVIIYFEVSGKASYDQNYQEPIWPKGDSGVTIGIGYDLGYNTAEQIRRDWNGVVANSIVDDLVSVAGIIREEAKEKAEVLKEKGVKITFDQAYEVFSKSTLPSHGGKARSTYPGLEQLPPDAQGALLSLIFNRGTGLTGDSRTEMANIKEYVAKGDIEAIAKELEAMVRVWEGTDIFNGLKKRRDAEAAMVRKSDRTYSDDEIVYV